VLWSGLQNFEAGETFFRFFEKFEGEGKKLG
jgi:hypothetical protein